MNKSLKSDNQNHTEETTKLQADIEKLQSERYTKDDEIKELKRKNNELIQENKVAQDEIGIILGEKQTVANELSEETQKFHRIERLKSKQDKTLRDLTEAKQKLTNERNKAIEERNQTQRYLMAIEREFSWLKKQADEEQSKILKLAQDRDKLATEHLKHE